MAPERGSALLTSVALLVVLSGMGAALSNMYVSNSNSTAENVKLNENINLAQTGLNLGGYILKDTSCLEENNKLFPGYYLKCQCSLSGTGGGDGSNDDDGNKDDGNKDDKEKSNNGLGNNVDEDGNRTMCDPSNPSAQHSGCDASEDNEAHGLGSDPKGRRSNGGGKDGGKDDGNKDDGNKDDGNKDDGNKDGDGTGGSGNDDAYTVSCDLIKTYYSSQDGSNQATTLKESASLSEIRNYLITEQANTQDATSSAMAAAVLASSILDPSADVLSWCPKACNTDGNKDDGKDGGKDDGKDDDKEKSNNGLGNNVDEDGNRTMCDPSNPSAQHSACDASEDNEAHGLGSDQKGRRSNGNGDKDNKDNKDNKDDGKDGTDSTQDDCKLPVTTSVTLDIGGKDVRVTFEPAEGNRHNIKSIADPVATFDQPSRGVQEQAQCVKNLDGSFTIKRIIGTWKELYYKQGVEN
jgi:hypothetical protein